MEPYEKFKREFAKLMFVIVLGTALGRACEAIR